MALGTAIIVGVGPGLGLALTRTFAHAGHPVAMLARDKTKLDAYAAELTSTGHDVRGYAADAADPDSLRAALHTAITELGEPDVLVYNAGVVREDAPLGGDDQDWANVTAVNVLGARVAADAVLPQLREGRGSLLFTGGGLALFPSPQYTSLSVGKAALRAYVQALHAQLAGTGVHATSITIAGAIGGDEERFDAAVLAQAYLDLHQQPETQWQHELLRD
ncbi:NAD(P)-dependent dehydrogenase (short-subunit alcohol dehydrogenase family) [Streptomyces sp. LBL]|uniref:SDR family oxidoreductase n=1 Tax=Streptomyces sp. LBL TaxID=2940562 RepID=UPI0024734072|nr:SDR family NAD(P)-dependent oxidoreductase [Streptomyces sp. LBL]MDH6630526.1 NAD(P)-dependent dehydrogenase (short-subunit alcohol dehydrogenase family) [Streptomyces sp. LBL]